MTSVKGTKITEQKSQKLTLTKPEYTQKSETGLGP